MHSSPSTTSCAQWTRSVSITRSSRHREGNLPVRNREGNELVTAAAAGSAGRLLAYAVATPWLGAEAIDEASWLGRRAPEGSSSIPRCRASISSTAASTRSSSLPSTPAGRSTFAPARRRTRSHCRLRGSLPAFPTGASCWARAALPTSPTTAGRARGGAERLRGQLPRRMADRPCGRRSGWCRGPRRLHDGRAVRGCRGRVGPRHRGAADRDGARRHPLAGR